MKVVKGVRTRLYLSWNISKNKHHLYLDGKKVCKLSEKQWMRIAMHLEGQGDKANA